MTDPERQDADQIAECARDAAAAIQQLCRLTITRPPLAPAEVDVVLADLAAAISAIPQAATQLNAILEHARNTRDLEMDTLTDNTDPDVAIDMARLHLDVAHVHANDLYRSLDAAHQHTAHIGETDHRGQAAGRDSDRQRSPFRDPGGHSPAR